MKYIIDVPDDLHAVNGTVRVPVIIENGDTSCYTYHYTYLIAEPYTEPDCKAIENEVWEFARKIICSSDYCEDDISKYIEKLLKAKAIFKGLSYQEAKAKYDEWKKQKDEIVELLKKMRGAEVDD